jgi:predicted MFS family arabinose efflux permease
VGFLVGAFAIGGLIYSLSVAALIPRLGQIRFTAIGGVLLALGFVTLALTPYWQTTPLSVVVVGFGFYMLHNTLQTNATQMSPEARGTAVGLFSAALYLGQTVGVAAAAPVVDSHGAAPVFLIAGAMVLTAGVTFSRKLKKRQAGG